MRFDDYENCEQCQDLRKLRTNIVWGFGNEHCSIMFVGEGPGREEDIQGKPFVGESGIFLEQLLEEVKLARSEIYITNTVLCRPTRPGSENNLVNRDPTALEVSNCLPRLHREIVAIDPIMIVSLGAVPASALRGKKVGIKKARGSIIDIKIRTGNDVILTYALMPVFHPSYLLRTHSEEDIVQTVRDIRTAKAVVDRYKKTAATTRV